jgi:hypothetical protein
MIRQHRRIATAVGLALALAASIAPAAWADPQPLASAEAAIATNARATTAVRPNPDEQTVTQATVNSGPCSEACSGSGYGFGNSSSAEPGGPLPSDSFAGTRLFPQHGSGSIAAAHAPAVAHVTAPSGGFDWGDAAVGAGVMLALTLIGVGGVLTVARRRSHSATPTTRPTPQGQN